MQWPEPFWDVFFRQCRRVNRATCALVCKQWLLEMRRYPKMPVYRIEMGACTAIDSPELGLSSQQWASMQVTDSNQYKGWFDVRKTGDLLIAPTDLLVRVNDRGPFSLPAGQQLPIVGSCFCTIRILPMVGGFASDCAFSMIWLPVLLRWPKAMIEYWDSSVLQLGRAADM